MEIKKITLEELKTKYGWEDEESVKTILGRKQEGDKILLYQNCNLDSSRRGSQHLVLAGPGRTLSADDPPKEIDPFNTGGSPSAREQLQGELILGQDL
jgi:hypothetical protein